MSKETNMTTDEKYRVRVPQAGEWIRVNPDPDMCSEETLAKDDAGEIYLIKNSKVESELLAKRPDRVFRAMIFMAQNREGETFLWPVKMPVSKEHLAYRAMREWISYPVLQ
jgi:hypothetical protein